MVIAFQVILIIVILLGFMGALVEKENENLRNNMSALCIAGMIAFIVSVVIL